MNEENKDVEYKMEVGNPLPAVDSLSMGLYKLRESKPNDRTEYDRLYAICITETEKLIAIVNSLLVNYGNASNLIRE